MIDFFLACIAYWCALVLSIYFLPGRILRYLASWSILFIYLLTLCALHSGLESCQRLFLTTIGLLLTIKASVLLQRTREQIRSFSRSGLALYLSIWPGIDPQPLKARQDFAGDCATRFVRGYLCFLAGLLGCLVIAILEPQLGSDLTGWAGICAIGLTIHFGYADVLSSLLQMAGWKVRPLFDQPLLSITVREFWSKRWNTAFVEMNKILFLPLVKSLVRNKYLALACVFFISGFLHEMAINYSSRGSCGGPSLYFLLQAVVLLIEDKRAGKGVSPYLLRAMTWLCIVLPLPLLFTQAFRSEFVTPLFHHFHEQIVGHEVRWYFSLALWIAAVGNFCAIAAGIQLPFRLNWREELACLSNFNRKIFINYYFYIGLMVLTWGSLTIVLHDDMLRGDRTSMILTGVIAVFWTVRLIVDLFYFKHSDWPKGVQFVIGHALLTTLFVFLSFSYLGLIVWQAFRA